MQLDAASTAISVKNSLTGNDSTQLGVWIIQKALNCYYLLLLRVPQIEDDVAVTDLQQI